MKEHAMRLRKSMLAMLSAGALGAGLFAPAALAAAEMSHATAKLPPEMTQGEVRYVSGGIGRPEADVFKRAAARYPLSLEFALEAKPHDEYTANVRVAIRDANGKVALLTLSEGPFLLAKLPAGIYDVKATHQGRTLERHVSIAEGRQAHVTFVWPKNDSRANG
jgi:hypothetical protein